MKASRDDIERLTRGQPTRGVNVAALLGAESARVNLTCDLPAGEPAASVTVPVCPPANNLYPGKARRYTSPEYKAWKAVAYPVIKTMPPPTAFPVQVWVVVRGKLHPSSDISNREKATTDALVACGVIPDDRIKYVCGTHPVYLPDDGELRMEIRFTPPEDWRP